MLPKSFTVFSPLVDQEKAIMILIGKIGKELAALNIDDTEGVMCFIPVSTWQEFADIQVDDHVKMIALGTAVTTMFLEMMAHTDELVAPVIKDIWVPSD